MTSIDRNLQKKKELENSYNELSDELDYYNEEFHKIIEPALKYSLKKNIERVSSQRDAVEEQIERLDQGILASHLYDLLKNLLTLDFKDHVNHFLQNIAEHRTGAFLIHGSSQDTQNSLLMLKKRILQEVSYNLITECPIMIDLAGLFCQTGCLNMFEEKLAHPDIVEMLWRDLRQRYRLKRGTSSAKIAEKVAQKRKTQNVIMVLEGIDIQCDVNKIINEFWKTLVSKEEQESAYLLLILIVNDCNYFDDVRVNFVDIYQDACIPVRLPALEKFVQNDIEHWITEVPGVFCPEEKIRAKLLAKEIFQNSGNGLPDRVIEYIFEQVCNYEFDEGVLQEWLRQY